MSERETVLGDREREREFRLATSWVFSKIVFLNTSGCIVFELLVVNEGNYLYLLSTGNEFSIAAFLLGLGNFFLECLFIFMIAKTHE